MRSTGWGAGVLAIAVALAACGRDSSQTSEAGTSSVRVLAAASLTESFTELGKAFEADHRGARVTFDFGASSTLALQVEQGAPADVYASADAVTMQTLEDAGELAGRPTIFARNRLSLLVETGNPKGIHALADLGRDGVTFVLCAPAVPCGRLGQTALDRAGVDTEPASFEQDVKAVVAKVSLGEVDAGIGYRTDAVAAEDDLDSIDIPADQNVETAYPLASLDGAMDPEAAQAFVDFACSPEGAGVLERFGFLPP